MSHKRLVDLLKCDDLIVESEERVYESVLAWIRFDLNNREKYVADIMSNVRFPRMQKEYLSSHVETEPLIENNSCCKEYILEAYKLQLFETNRPTIDSTRIRHRCDRLKYMLIACGKTDAIELRDLNYSNLMFQKPCMPTKREQYGNCCLNLHKSIVCFIPETNMITYGHFQWWVGFVARQGLCIWRFWI